MQVYLQHMVALIPERKSYFIVDPNDTGIKLLGGAQSLGQLQAAWLMISKRMDAAQRFVKKYEEEYKGEGEPPNSPALTALELHQEVGEEKYYASKLRTIYGKFPQHNAQFEPQQCQEVIRGFFLGESKFRNF
jgi:hypothetical protein